MNINPNMMLLEASDSWWVKWLKAFFTWVWSWFYMMIVQFAVWIIGLFLFMIPEDWCPAMGQFLIYLEYANCWVALDFGIGLLSVFYAFSLVFIITKLILKLIPTIG